MTTRPRLGPSQLKWRARWVLELLDTDAGQAQSTLCAYDKDTKAVLGYCCLGIAERLRAPNSNRLRPGTIDSAMGHIAANEGMMGIPGERTFGMNDEDQEVAAEWNDTSEWGFHDIARMVAWLTSQGHVRFDDVRGEEDYNGDRPFEWDDIAVPSDFDERAWAQGVLS